MRSSCVTYLQLGRLVSVSQLGRLVSVSSDISAHYGRTTREKMRLGMIHLRGRLVQGTSSVVTKVRYGRTTPEKMRLGMIHLRGRLVWVDLFKGRLRWLPRGSKVHCLLQHFSSK